LQKIIDGIKGDFRTEISRNGKEYKKLQELQYEYNLLVAPDIFKDNAVHDPKEMYGSKENFDKSKERIKKLGEEINRRTQEIREIENNVIYKNAFEWRFEFPEVLNNDGDFEGFDLIIGNPPYIPLEAFDTSTREIIRNKYPQVERKYDTSVLFILEGYKLLKEKGSLSYIAPITWQTGENYSKFRKFIISNFGIDYIINLPFNTFENAYVETSIYKFVKDKLSEYKIYNFNKKEDNDSLEKVDFSVISYEKLIEPNYKIILDSSSNDILERFDAKNFVSLGLITKST